MGRGGAALLLAVGGEGAGLGEAGDCLPAEVGGAGVGLLLVVGGDGAGLEGALGIGFGAYDLEGGGAVGGGVSVDGVGGLGDSESLTPLLMLFMAGEWWGLRGVGLGLGLGMMVGFSPSPLSPGDSLCGKVGVLFSGRGGFRTGFAAGTGMPGLEGSVVH